MAKRLRTALVLALSGLGLPTALSADEPALDCTAAGYDVLLKNAGPDALPAETPIAWSVRFVRRSGELVLDKPLAPGESLFISGALGSDYLSSPQPCTATVAQE